MDSHGTVVKIVFEAHTVLFFKMRTVATSTILLLIKLPK